MSNGMMVTDTQKLFQIDCDVDITVPDDGTEFHVADIVYAAALQQSKKHKQGVVKPGKRYAVKVLAVVVELPEGLEDTTINSHREDQGLPPLP